MHRETITADRLIAFSDGVSAVIVNVVVLALSAESTGIRCAVVAVADGAQLRAKHLFIAVIWVNHHHLMRFVTHLTPASIWINFAHLFLVSFLPFPTA